MTTNQPKAQQTHLLPKSTWLLLVLLTAAILLLSNRAEAGGAVIYVRASASGANNGTSWANAFTNLQTALNSAGPGSEIWVAAGTYKPTTGSDRTASFSANNMVHIYGGFAGTETQRSQRNPKANVTILSGDLLGNDNGNLALDEPTRQDNSYHVVRNGVGNTIGRLDGFTITGGHANGDSAQADGGGIYSDNNSFILANLILIHNVAKDDGGGLRNAFADLTISNVQFIGNRAAFGGAVYTVQAEPTLLNVVFSGNVASVAGGGVFITSSNNLSMVNVTFSHNTASNSGGGIYRQAGPLTVTNSIFWGNIPQAIRTNDAVADPVTVTYSLVENGYTGSGNISANPQFTNAKGADQIAGTRDDDLSLFTTSPAIDAGQNSAVPADTADLDQDSNTAETTPRDLALNPRFYNHPNADTGSGTPPLVDMGAFEAQAPPTPVAVSGKITGGNNAPAANVLVSIMHIEGIEVTQAVQNINNTIPLVQDKDTIARIYAPANGTTSPVAVPILLNGTRNNFPLPGSPLTVGPTNLANKTAPSRSAYDSSFNILLPASWLSGEVTLTAELDLSAGYADMTDSNGNFTLNLPPGTYTIQPQKEGVTFLPRSRTVTLPTSQPVNFTMLDQVVYLPMVVNGSGATVVAANEPAYSQQTAVTVQFTNLPPLRLTIVPIRYTSAVNAQVYEPPTDFSAIVEGLKRAYPVDDVELTVHATLDVTGVSGQFALNPVLDAVVALKANEAAPANHVYYGVTAANLSGADAQGVYGWASVGSRTASAVGEGPFLAIHEIGHTFGLGHSCDDPNFPYLDGATGEYGLDVALEFVYAPDVTRDFMSTSACPVNNPNLSYIWFSDYHYVKLFNDQLANGNTAVFPTSEDVNRLE